MKFTWLADINLDGVVDSNDAFLFGNAYNESLPHLPEPASLGLLALGAGGLLLRRRRFNESHQCLLRVCRETPYLNHCKCA